MSLLCYDTPINSSKHNKMKAALKILTGLHVLRNTSVEKMSMLNYLSVFTQSFYRTFYCRTGQHLRAMGCNMDGSTVSMYITCAIWPVL